MSEFDTASRNVLAGFLRTAVVIDDAAYPPKSGTLACEAQGVTSPPAEVRMPGRADVSKAPEPEPPARAQSGHELDTRLMVDSFAEMGLVCAVIAPRKDEDVTARLGNVAEHCDIVIIDWQMFNDDGERTLALIEALCKRDCGERLRLVCVYSGEPEMAKISERLRGVTELKAVGGDDLLLRKDHIIVTILQKSAVPQDKIAGELVDRFSGFTKGLLSNAVLAALAGIRRNVHRVVGKFGAELDPAYITHRIMSVPVETVEGEILSLIASELESMVHQSDAASCIDNEAIVSWMGSDAGQRIKYDDLPCKNADGPELLKELIKYGADGKREGVTKKFKDACVWVSDNSAKKSRLTGLLVGGDGKRADRRFAMLSTLETRYEKYVRQLTLGTIVHDGTQYLLCLMPRCDSARVPTNGRNFLFIRLAEGSSEVDLIVEDGSESVNLGISRHPYDTVIYRFASDVDKKPVSARKEEDDWRFGCTIPDGSVGSVRWVAELKPQIAQAFANEYAAQVSRVGVKKSQWLHGLGKKEK